MPAPQLKSLAKEADKSLPDVEKLWDKAKSAAAKEGKEKNYPYIMGILKHMLGIKSEKKESFSRYKSVYGAD